MADVFTKKKRSEVMSRIKGTNTKPEILVRKFLFSKGLRFRIHQKKLVGKPDIVLKKHNSVVFVYGCFWHGHLSTRCMIARMPKSNTKFWKDKITYNQTRHTKNEKQLRKDGWRVITVWECQLRGSRKTKTLQAIVDKILQSE